MGVLAWLLTFVGTNILIGTIYHDIEKNVVADEARKYARSRRKPILDFGCGNLPKGDVNVDIVSRQAKNFILIQRFDKPHLPFPNKHFASTLAFHVLEHTDDPEHTLKELERVSDKVYIITPKPIWLLTWLNPDHRWIFITDEAYMRNPLYRDAKFYEDLPLLYPERRS